MKKIFVVLSSMMLASGAVNAGSILIINSTGAPLVLNHIAINSVANPLIPIHSSPATYTIPTAGSGFWASPSAMLTAVGGPSMPGLTPTTAMLHDMTFRWSGGVCGIGIGYDHGPFGPNSSSTISCGGVTRTATYSVTGPNMDVIINVS